MAYTCSKCGVSGIKLWRIYQGTKLLCAQCAAYRQKEYILDIDQEGKHTSFFTFSPESEEIIMSRKFHRAFKRGKIPRKLKKRMQQLRFYIHTYIDGVYQGYLLHAEKIDQIGWYVPAIPVEREDDMYWWGYMSVPDEGIAWWYALPTLKV